jgi:phosphatidylglycerophosphatase A
MNSIFKNIATLSFIGYIPVAPGTFGTLAALILYIFLKPSLSVQVLLLCFIIPIGTVSAHRAEKALDAKDSRHIVIDEFCGYFCSLLFMPFSITYAIAAFFLFRIFDILKPFPIRRMEVVFQGGIGVMADDIMAAVYTNIILQIWRHVQ